MKIGIIGLGLIGSSLARAFKKNNDEITIYGDDNKKDNLKYCINNKIIDKQLNDNIKKELDILFVAVPVSAVVSVIEKNLKYINRDKTIITDVGSTKLNITTYMKKNYPECRFIGGHPMAGKERNGPAEGDADLFKNGSYFLIMEDKSILKWQKKLINIIKKTGAKVMFFKAEDHDKLVSFTSHLPQFLATGFINEFINFEENNKNVTSLVGQGFKDFSRIAASNPEIWVDIFLTNKKNLINNIESTIKQYQKLLTVLKNGDEAKIKEFLIKARKKRKEL